MRPPDLSISSYSADFASGLLDPDRGAPAIVVASDARRVAKRYDVYRNNVTVSLIRALMNIYPAVHRITGDEFFRAMARFHVRATPPRSPLLFEYGRSFPDFIACYEFARSMPWLPDVARIERAWLDAYHAEDIEPLGPTALATVPLDRIGDLVFTSHPAAWIVGSEFSAATIFATNKGETAVGRIDASNAEYALITRPATDVVVRILPAPAGKLMAHLMAGGTLGEAAAVAMQADPTFDLSAGITGIVEAGAFTAMHFEEKT
jgi:hypothetical protein